jgi:SsrA-binding protein
MRKIDPKRARQLLLKKDEVIRLNTKIKHLGATLVPLEVYSKGNLIKVSIALVK